MIGYADAAQGAGGEARARRADGHRHLQLHRDRRRRAVASTSTSSGIKMFDSLRDPHPPDRQGASRASAPSRRARATRRPTRRSSPRSWASRPRTSRSRKATPTPRPTAWAPTPAARTPTAGAAGGDGGAQDPRQGARRSPRTCWRCAEEDLVWEPGKFHVKGAPDRSRRPSRRSPSPPTPTIRRAWRPGWRRWTTTTRRT